MGPRAMHGASSAPSLTHVLDLPDDVLAAVLCQAPPQSRAACRTFLRLLASRQTHLRLWLADGAHPPTGAELRRTLSHLPHLSAINAARLRIHALGSIALPSLTTLDLRVFYNPNARGGADPLATTNLHPLAACTRLTSLNLTNAYSLADLSGVLGSRRTLTFLGIYGCPTTLVLTPLASCARLARLYVGPACEFGAVNSLGRPGGLNLAPIAGCPALAALTISGYVTDLAPLAGCAALLSLNLSACRGLQVDVGALAACTALTRLSVWGCDTVRDYRPLGDGCPALRKLRVPEGAEERSSCKALAVARPQLQISFS